MNQTDTPLARQTRKHSTRRQIADAEIRDQGDITADPAGKNLITIKIMRNVTNNFR